MDSSRYRYIFFFVVFLAALVLMYLVVKPFIAPVFIALVLAVVFKGYHGRMERRFGKNAGALLSVFSVVVVIIVPLALISMLIFFEAQGGYNNLSHIGASGGFWGGVISYAQTFLRRFVPGITLDPSSYIQSGLNWLIEHTGSLFSSFFKIFLDLVIMLIGLFYLFKDGKEAREYFVSMSPLDRSDDTHILDRLELTINSVVRGTLIIGVIQGVQVGLGFWIFGIGQPALWGFLAGFASLVPGVGTALVSVPAIIILFYQGHLFQAIGYTLWYLLALTFVDNILQPHIIDRKVNIHPFLILISVLGGLVFFGPIGFLAGPITLAFASELLKLYPRFSSRQNS